MSMELCKRLDELLCDDPPSKLFVTPINEEYLNEGDCALSACGDVCLLLRLLISDDNERTATVRVTNHIADYIMKNCGLSYTDLVDTALKNTEEKWPVYYVDVDKMLRTTPSIEWNDMFAPLSDGLPEEKPLFLTINYGPRITFGAGAVFHSGVMRGISEYYNSDLFITFTSIHEANVHPYDPERISPEALLESLIETHKECVDETDFLSDKLYLYSRDMGYIREYFIEEVIPQ